MAQKPVDVKIKAADIPLYIQFQTPPTVNATISNPLLTVGISGTPTVSISGTSTIGISGTPTVGLTAGTSVGVIGTIPVSIINFRPDRLDLKTLSQIEGRIWSVNNSGVLSYTAATKTVLPNNSTVFSGSSVAFATSGIPVGHAFVPDFAVISSNKTINIAPVIGASSLSTGGPVYTFGSSFGIDIEANRPQTFPVSGLIRWQASAMTSTISEVTEPYNNTANSTNTTSVRVSLGLVGNLVTDDFNTTADYIIDLWGDSILFGTGPTQEKNLIAFLIRNYFTGKGNNVRHRNNAVSGSTSSNHDIFRQVGYYNRQPAKIHFVMLGTNDINAGTSATVTSANIVNIASQLLATDQTCKVVIMAIPPVNNSTKDAASTVTSNQIQSDLATLATSLGLTLNPAYTQANTGRLYYIAGTRTAWTFSDATKTTDGTHPNDTGAPLMFNGAIKPFLDTYIPTLK